MKKLFLSFCLLLAIVGWAAVPPTTLEISNADPVVTESWVAHIVFYLAPLEGRFAETCPLKAPSASPFGSMFDEARTGLALQGFPVEGARFKDSIARETKDGVDYWRVTLTSDPIPATRAGKIDVGPVVVEASLFDGRFQRGFFGAQPHVVRRQFRTPRVTVTVHEPPAEGRPEGYSGAIARNLAVSAKLDSSLCTAGDPLMLTLTMKGAADPSRIRAPSFAALLKKGGVFRVDEASVKSRVEGDARIFTWRVRAIKAGTVEFPALPIAFFDAAARAYRTVQTESIPVQVKAGAQVALGLNEDDGSEEAFPMPDGLDLDFPDAGTADFTFRRATALACRAKDPAEFRAAAEAYAAYLGQLARDPMSWLTALTTFSSTQASVLARHCSNLGGLRLLGGDARGAYLAYARAGDFVGEGPAIRRGLQAACARLRNDPRADLPITRIFFGFWFRLTLPLRLIAALVALSLLALLWHLAGKLGRGGVLGLFLALTLVPATAEAQFGRRFSFGGGAGAGKVKASVALQPAETVVGEPSAFVFSFEVENGVDVDQLRFGDLPDPESGHLVYGEPTRLPDGVAAEKGHVLKRVKLPVRFLASFHREIAPLVEGMLVTRRGNGTSFSFTSSVNFGARCAPLKLAIAPLPEEGRPADFSGAVGKNFRLRQRLMPPRVHPGDLVTAEYALEFDGHFPTNALPKIEGLEAFKTYDIKEIKRTGSSVLWKQMLVPNSTAATNAARVTVGYYDVAAKRYATAEARPQKLVFVSESAASTENTAVLIDAHTAPGAHPVSASADAAVNRPLLLRFAPSETSPVVATLPPGTDTKTLYTRGAWRRVATPNAVGWTR